MSTSAFAPSFDKENIAPQASTQAAGNSKRARRHRAGHRKQMAILKSQQMSENMELESLKTQQALQNAEIAIQGAELSQLQSAAEVAQLYVDKLQDTQAVELDAIRQLQQEQDAEREEISILHQEQEHQRDEIAMAEKILRMTQQSQSQELRRLRNESTEEREQMESLRKQQEDLEQKADELRAAQGDERADIVLLKAQTDVHRERLVAHEVTLRELVLKQEACNELTEKELGDLQADAALDRAQIDRLFRRQQEEGGRLTEVQALLSVQEAQLSSDERRMDALSEMTQQLRNRHIEDLTLLQQEQAVEHQERLQSEAQLQAAQHEQTSLIRRLEKLREKEEPRLRLLERRQALEDAEMSVLRERQEQHEKDLQEERERAQSEETALLTATRAEVTRLNRDVLNMRTQLIERNRDIDRVVNNFDTIRNDHLATIEALGEDRSSRLAELAEKQSKIDELLSRAEWLQLQYAADCALQKVTERERDRTELTNLRENRAFDMALADASRVLRETERSDEQFVRALVAAAEEAEAEEELEEQIVDAVADAVAEAVADAIAEEAAEAGAIAMVESLMEDNGMQEAALIDAITEGIIEAGLENSDNVALILRQTDEEELIDAETGEVIGTAVTESMEIAPLAQEGHVLRQKETRYQFVTTDEEGRRIVSEVVEREEYEEFDEEEEQQEQEESTAPAIELELRLVENAIDEVDELERLANKPERERVAPSREFFPNVPRRRADTYTAENQVLALPYQPAVASYAPAQTFTAVGGRILPQGWNPAPRADLGLNRAFGWQQNALNANQGFSGYFMNPSTQSQGMFTSPWLSNPMSGTYTSGLSTNNGAGNWTSFMGSTVPLTMPSHMGMQSRFSQ